MVKLNKTGAHPRFDQLPEMPIHHLTVKKNAGDFKQGEHLKCWISKINDRFAVTDCDFSNVTKHYKVFTKKELDDTFDEVSVNMVE